MEIEKTLTVAAPREQVWALLLDPQVMAGAVPGMKSIDVVSPTEYVAVMHQKISFISARFKLRTHIVEQRAPEYLRAEGTGEDASVASSLKQQTEVFLTPAAGGGTELRLKVRVDLLGRLGTFGLGVMKTKADRLWDEFGANLAARLEGRDAAAAPVSAPPPAAPVAASFALPMPSSAASNAPPASPPVTPIGEPPRSTWWSRLVGGGAAPQASARMIRVEVRQLDKTVTVEWPVESAQACQDWLRELMK